MKSRLLGIDGANGQILGTPGNQNYRLLSIFLNL